MWQWRTNSRQGTNVGPWSSLWTPNKDVEYKPELGDEMTSFWKTNAEELVDRDSRFLTLDDLAGMREWLGELPQPSESFCKAAGLLKEAARWQTHGGAGGAGAGLRPVPMDAFNRAIWNDVRMGMTAGGNPFGSKAWQGDNTQGMHTPPPVAAAATAINTGIQDMYGGRSMLSPMHFVKGLATAGVDAAAANIVGKTLGALGGLSPEAQTHIQNIGLWGGLIRGTVGSMMGMS
jgi:hypothetical protein